MQTFFKTLEYRFLVESAKFEKATFLYKIAMSESNVKTNRMGSTKWTYDKELAFAVNCFIFFENFVSVYEPRKKSWFDVLIIKNVHSDIFRKHWNFIGGCFSPVSILIHFFFIRKPFFNLSLNFRNITLEIRLRFS